MRSGRQTAVVIGYSFVLSLHVPTSLATELVRKEPIPIQTILANPQAFNMRAVRLQGTITSLQVIPDGGDCQVSGMSDVYVFILNDGTGELSIFDRGTCQNMTATMRHAVKPQVAEFAAGDSIEVVVDVSLLYSPQLRGTLIGRDAPMDQTNPSSK